MSSGTKNASHVNSNSRLTSLTYTLNSGTLGNLTYTYDAAGRRTQAGGSWARTGVPLPVEAATYDPANELLSWASQSFSYDANGNVLSDGANSYFWNARNELSAMSGGQVAEFQYDGYGRRISKTLNSANTQLLYAGANIVQEIAAGSPSANLLSGGTDEIFMRTTSAGSASYLLDGSGSSLAVTDATGTVSSQYTFEPYGNSDSSPGANPYQFTGRENDQTGLYYYRARYYSPHLNRFISEDPLGPRAGVNPYVYASDDPLTHIDPAGLADVLIWPGDNPGSIAIWGGNWGHAAVVLGDGTYISWWPAPGTQRNVSEGGLLWDADAIVPSSYPHDAGPEGEGGAAPIRIHVSGLNEQAMEAWWQQYQTNRYYNTAGRNCSTTAMRALSVGRNPMLYHEPGPMSWPTWGPEDVERYAEYLASPPDPDDTTYPGGWWLLN